MNWIPSISFVVLVLNLIVSTFGYTSNINPLESDLIKRILSAQSGIIDPPKSPTARKNFKSGRRAVGDAPKPRAAYYPQQYYPSYSSHRYPQYYPPYYQHGDNKFQTMEVKYPYYQQGMYNSGQHRLPYYNNGRLHNNHHSYNPNHQNPYLDLKRNNAQQQFMQNPINLHSHVDIGGGHGHAHGPGKDLNLDHHFSNVLQGVDHQAISTDINTQTNNLLSQVNLGGGHGHHGMQPDGMDANMGGYGHMHGHGHGHEHGYEHGHEHGHGHHGDMHGHGYEQGMDMYGHPGGGMHAGHDHSMGAYGHHHPGGLHASTSAPNLVSQVEIGGHERYVVEDGMPMVLEDRRHAVPESMLERGPLMYEVPDVQDVLLDNPRHEVLVELPYTECLLEPVSDPVINPEEYHLITEPYLSSEVFVVDGLLLPADSSMEPPHHQTDPRNWNYPLHGHGHPHLHPHDPRCYWEEY